MDEEKYTLEEALAIFKKDLKQHVEKGANCALCNQFAKVYKRKIYSRAVYSLIRLYHLNEQKEDYYHITAINPVKVSGGGDFAKLVYWGLAEEKLKDPANTASRTSGFWRITDKGKAFVEGDITVPTYVRTYNGSIIGQPFGESITVQQSLGKIFDYDELMKS